MIRMRPMTVHGKIFGPVSQSQDRGCYLQKEQSSHHAHASCIQYKCLRLLPGWRGNKGKRKFIRKGKSIYADEVFFYFHLNFRLIQTDPGSGKSCFRVRGTVKDHHEDHTDQNSQTKNERGNIFFRSKISRFIRHLHY